MAKGIVAEILDELYRRINTTSPFKSQPMLAGLRSMADWIEARAAEPASLLPPSGDEVEAKIREALDCYLCQFSHFDDEGGACSLADLLSPGNTIEEGLEELDLLAEHIACELLNSEGGR